MLKSQLEKMDSIIITGAPWSGTTLLASMVGGDGRIGILNECFYPAQKKIVRKIVGNKLTIPNQIRSFPNYLDRILSGNSLIEKAIKK